MTSAEMVAAETAKYSAVWQQSAYRKVCHGLDLWTNRRDLFPAGFQSAIDIGCGLGLLIPALEAAGISASGVDLVPDDSLDEGVQAVHGGQIYQSSLWTFDPQRTWDVGVCADVMEHIPEPYIDECLSRMSQYCRKVVFKIAAFPSACAGHTLHLTRHTAPWWIERIMLTMPGSVTSAPYQTARDEFVLIWRRW